MNETGDKDNSFVGYEYKDVTVNRNLEPLYADSYENFGWKLDGTEAPQSNGPNAITLRFKRDRKIRNKAELSRLERQFDAYASEVLTLEHSKGFAASTAAYIIGVAGTGFMAGSVFSFLAGSLPLCIILAIPGLVGWVAPYICYSHIRKNKTAQVTPLIDSKHDEIYDVCLRANSLLARA